MGRGTSAMIETLYRLAEEHGVSIIENAHGQFQIKGHLTVYYYPFSAHRTAYVSGTKGTGQRGVDPLGAVTMATRAPDFVDTPVRRGRKGRRRRQQLMKAGHTTCRWCEDPLTLDTSTLEHVIPLTRGGLDLPQNWALACLDCNSKRGPDMPELDGWKPADKSPEQPSLIHRADLPLQEQKLILELLRAQFNANYSKLEADQSAARDEKSRMAIRAEKMKVGADIQRVKAELSGLNVKLAAATQKLYQATFKAVAKKHLSQDLFDLIEQEANRLYEAIPEEERLYVL